MEQELITRFTIDAIILALKLSAPLVGAAALIGLLFGVIQALTQLQDQTTTLALKVLAIFGMLALLAPWFGVEMMVYAERLFDHLGAVR